LASFDPFSLERFSVVKLPYRFEEDRLLAKFFIVLGHRIDGFGMAYAICIKATSQVAVYKNNPDKFCGCVYYHGGQLDCFPLDTVIEPDNQIPLSHKSIADAHFDNALECWLMPPDFDSLLRTAIDRSLTMNKRQKQRLLDVLDRPDE
jgi:hypothetical protein